MPTRKSPVVKFGTPPPAKTSPDWAGIAAALRKRPMEWAIVLPGCKHSTAVAAYNSKVKAVSRTRGFQCMTRNNKMQVVDGKSVRTCDLWMRYNPDKDKEE